MCLYSGVSSWYTAVMDWPWHSRASGRSMISIMTTSSGPFWHCSLSLQERAGQRESTQRHSMLVFLLWSLPPFTLSVLIKFLFLLNSLWCNPCSSPLALYILTMFWLKTKKKTALKKKNVFTFNLNPSLSFSLVLCDIYAFILEFFMDTDVILTIAYKHFFPLCGFKMMLLVCSTLWKCFKFVFQHFL